MGVLCFLRPAVNRHALDIHGSFDHQRGVATDQNATRSICRADEHPAGPPFIVPCDRTIGRVSRPCPASQHEIAAFRDPVIGSSGMPHWMNRRFTG